MFSWSNRGAPLTFINSNLNILPTMKKRLRGICTKDYQVLSVGNALLESERVYMRPQWYAEFAVISTLLIFFSKKTHSSSPAI